jgi:1-phosphatidylinositol phosphodiesterase
LEAGIRCVDIRVDSGVHIHHGGVRQGFKFIHVLQELKAFLEQNPSEFVLMKLQVECAPEKVMALIDDGYSCYLPDHDETDGLTKVGSLRV